MSKQTYNADWSELLVKAVNEPGVIHAAYTAFYNYSFGNQLAAWSQCAERDLPIGPIATYQAWKSKDRQVSKGQKAIWLCQPITIKEKQDDGSEKIRTWFKWAPHWFVLAQTEGDQMPAEVVLPEWTESKALETLKIEKTTFKQTDGNIMGYATDRKIAISPLTPFPHKTLFHELAHIVLGHTDISHQDDKAPRSLKEVEAESVALILCETLGLEGAKYSRGYIQSWLQTENIPAASAQKVFSAATTILNAGREAQQA